MTESRPTLQFDLDLEAVRLLHRSVSFHLEKWPGGPDPREQVSALTVLVKAELKQRCREQGLHRLQGLLLSGIWSPGPFLKVKADRAVKQANSFKIQIELEGGLMLTHGSILPNTTLTAHKGTSST